jgi:outer membrane protein OmpA-like peptidoglycan-associated protein/Tol biopolymer transport system component
MKNLFSFFVIIFLFLSGTVLFAQNGKAIQLAMEDAERLFNQGKLDAAKSKLQDILKEQSDFSAGLRLMGLIEMKLGNMVSSVTYYEKLFALKANLSRGAYFEAAEAYMKQYKYNKALEFYLLYKYSQQKDYKTNEESTQRNYDRVIDFNIADCEYSLENNFTGQLDQPLLLKGNINSSQDEFLPTLTVNGDLLLFTTRRDGNENIMVAGKNKEGDWINAHSIGNAINTPNNEGMAKFTTCGRKIYFSACAWENVLGGCDIYMAEYDTKNKIIDKVEPANGLNSELWDSQPSISCDGSTMYFVSTREGGQGGSDIWLSILQTNGSWGVPVNLGPTINTKGDEETPFIAPDGITLYFSSDGHPGMGEADIFMTGRKEDGKSWSTPINLGETVNSPYREAGIVITSDNNTAYFSSARTGGKGGLDIYQNSLNSLYKPKVDNVLLDGYVYDETSKMPVEGATIRVRSGNKAVGNFVSDKDGRFFMCVPSAASYSYIVDKAGYESYVNADYFERSEDEPTLKVEVLLTKGGNVVNPSNVIQPRLRKNLSVYFESGKNELSDVQKEQIAKLVTQFENPSALKINVTGFADDIGDKTYNQSLSQKRAEAVTVYLKEIGVPLSLINTEGKGMIESDMAKHQKRRVEIIILN